MVFIGGCAVTDAMRGRCEMAVLETMQRLGQARFVVFGCLAAFPDDLKSVAGGYAGRLHIIPYHESHKLDELNPGIGPLRDCGRESTGRTRPLSAPHGTGRFLCDDRAGLRQSLQLL